MEYQIADIQSVQNIIGECILMGNGQQTPRILIVGAGAMGLVTGYHLQLAGAAVAFLVRPARALEMSRSQVLY
jgi:NADPH-dependent 2,4-dienoyl-CoA reductase/sulfur reductase-like enzyme